MKALFIQIYKWVMITLVVIVAIGLIYDLSGLNHLFEPELSPKLQAINKKLEANDAEAKAKSMAQRQAIKARDQVMLEHKVNAVVICKQYTRSQLHYSSSFDYTGREVRELKIGFSVWINFNAKNGFGNIVPQRAFCRIDNDGRIITFKVNPR